ncbi:hypothetical protein LC085_05580 [Bacillus tianshenii]|nr:hypothetical protein [Bacillus tianshenii]MCA1319378.1 hypothetical protein [Bacillus tianshenii]
MTYYAKKAISVGYIKLKSEEKISLEVLKMKRNMIIIITLGIIFLSTQTVMATPPFKEGNVVSNFIHTLVRKGEKESRAFTVPEVKIPEIREKTPITGFSGLNSPNENVRVLIGYFESGENESKRIAFIWEVTSNKEKVTDIRVVFDGSNPFIDEAKAIQEYQDKRNTPILTASEFPFDITHIDADFDKDTLMLRYKNADLQGLVQIKIVPSDTDLKKLKGENDEYYTLKSGTKALYQNVPSAHQLIFQHRNSRYSIGISKTTKKDITVGDLLKIANSMF